MKCINGIYGEICKKGIFRKVITQEEYTFRFSDIRRVLLAYKEWSSNTDDTFHFYSMVRDMKLRPFGVYFYNYKKYNVEKPVIEIGCKKYYTETVNKAIKAFL